MKLRYLRKQIGLSQYALAQQLGLSRATYANYETGFTEPSLDTLIRIADFYGVSLDYLCDHPRPLPPSFSEQDTRLLRTISSLPEPQKHKLLAYLNKLELEAIKSTLSTKKDKLC